MKITHVALAATILLVGAAIYLLVDSKASKDKEQLQNQLNELKSMLANQRQQQPILPAPGTAPQPVPSVAPDAVPAAPGKGPKTTATSADLAVNPDKTPSVAAAPGTPKSPSPADADVSLPDPAADLKVSPEEQKILDDARAAAGTAEPRLTEKQQRLRNLPAIAKVKTFNEQHSFVVIDAGTNRNLNKGMKFSIRRESMLIGRATIGETVDVAESVADVDPKSIPVGVVLKAGDELVQYE